MPEQAKPEEKPTTEEKKGQPAEEKEEKKEKKEKKVVHKGKKPHKNKPTSKKYKFYTIEGDNIKRERYCPRCGPGVFLAVSENRLYCGKCHLTEFISKKDNSDKQEEPVEKEEKEQA